MTGTAWTESLRFTHPDSDMLSTRVPLESSSTDAEMEMESPPPDSSCCCGSDPSFSSISMDDPDPPLSIRTGILARTGFNVLGMRRERGDPNPCRRGRRPSPETAHLPSHSPSTPRHSASTRITRAASRVMRDMATDNHVKQKKRLFSTLPKLSWEQGDTMGVVERG